MSYREQQARFVQTGDSVIATGADKLKALAIALHAEAVHEGLIEISRSIDHFSATVEALVRKGE